MQSNNYMSTGVDGAQEQQSYNNVEAIVLSALEVLYQKQVNPEQQQAADAYLRSFQPQPEAYCICLNLLDRNLTSINTSSTGNSLPILFFASQTLANKLRRQHRFPKELENTWTYLTWSNKIIQWLSVTAPKMVQTQLILALVACLARVSKEELIANGHQKGVIGFILDQCASTQLKSNILVEFLVVFVEEVNEIHDSEVRQMFLHEIDTWAQIIMNQMLPQLMQEACSTGSTSNDVNTQQLILQALKSWIRYAQVPCAFILENVLVQSFLNFLTAQEGQLFEQCVDLIVEIVHAYHDIEHDFLLIQWLVPQIMQLKDPFFQASKEENTDFCLGLCRIFTEMAESYLLLLLTEQEFNQTSVIELLLECMSYPEVEIAAVTMPFWSLFLQELDTQQETLRSRLIQKYTPSLRQLARLNLQKLQFNENFPTLPVDKQQDFKAFRHELGDILRDCCALVGPRCILEECVNGLHAFITTSTSSSPSNHQWQAIEAHLYCFRSIARHVERQLQDPSVQRSLVMLFNSLSVFPDHPAIRYTSCLILSRYAEWLSQNPDYLGPQMQFLHQTIMNSTQSVAYSEWEVPRAAATAIRSLGMDCWHLIGKDILQFYLYIQKHDVLEVEDQVLLLEGICQGVCTLGHESRTNAVLELMDQCIQPILERLSSPLATQNSTLILQELLRLMCFFEYISINDRRDQQQHHPLVVLTEKIWPLFNQVLNLHKRNDEVVERVCRCYKRMLRTCGSHFKPFIPQMVENLVGFYQIEPKSSYLYCGSMVLKYFYEEKEFTQLFEKMLTQFQETTFPCFQTMDGFLNHPEVVEEFFYLMERALKCIPKSLIESSSGYFQATIQCASASFQVVHNEANKSAFCYLEQVFHFCTSTTGSTSNSMAIAIIQELFHGPIGKELVSQVLKGIVYGRLPSSRLDADYGSVAGLFVQLAKVDGIFFQELLTNLFAQEQQVTTWLQTEESQRFLQDLFTSKDERTFRRTVRHFGRLCGSKLSSSNEDNKESSID